MERKKREEKAHRSIFERIRKKLFHAYYIKIPLLALALLAISLLVFTGFYKLGFMRYPENITPEEKKGSEEFKIAIGEDKTEGPIIVKEGDIQGAIRLFKKGEDSKKHGKFHEALPYFEKSLEISKKLSNAKLTSDNLHNIGVVYHSIGQYKKALSYYEDSLKIRKELNIPEDQAKSLNNIGSIYNAFGQYEKALSYHEESLKIKRELNIPKGIATSLHNIGSVYDSLGQYKKALSYYEESLKIKRELNIPKSIATSLHNIGNVYHSLGQYEKALSYYEDSLKIRKELNIQQDIAGSLNNTGLTYLYLGQYEKALSYFEDSLKINIELNIPQDEAITLSNIGLVYESFGQYEKALSYFEESLKIDRKLDIPQNITLRLNNIGLVYRSLGQYGKAISCYKESLKIDRKLNIPQNIAMNLNNLGFAYNSLGQYERALSYFEDSLKIYRKLNIPQYIALNLNNIGYVYFSQKRYEEAEKRFFEVDKEKSNSNFVELYIATGRNEEALSLLKEMIPKWYDPDPLRFQFHTRNGLVLKGKGMLKESSSEFFKAVSVSEEMRQRIKERVMFLEAGVYGGRIRAYRGLMETLSERLFRKKGHGKLKDTGSSHIWISGKDRIIQDEIFSTYGKDLSSAAFYFSELTKARTLLEEMAESARRYHKPEIPSEIREKEEDILNQLSTIEKIWEETYKKGEEGFKALIKRKEDLKKELDLLISRIRKQYPKYALLNYPRPIPPEELPLEEDEILLEYAIGDDASYVYRVKKGGVEKVLRIEKGREEIEELVNEFIQPLQSPDTKKDFSSSLGEKLYQILLEGVVKDISSDEDIIIVPDGILGLLPFEALVITPGKELKETVFVGDKCKISYYQSATVLAFNRILKPSKAKRVLFALGNPIYDKDDPRYIAYKEGKPQPILLAQDLSQYSYRALATRRGWGKTTEDDEEVGEIIYTPLWETEAEVKEIAKLFGIPPVPPDVLLNVYANETTFCKSPLKDYIYLHFATHADLPGKVQGINEPFLLLSQVENKGKDDGFLTLTEILELNLDADMVVLSACLTGRGEVMEGEGVLNFARAFHHAGAKSVVVSLWEVASNETVEYMKLFYENLKEGKTKAEALSQARKEIKSKYPNPFHWAPFILHGER